jgi:hypothetical protein
MFIVPENIPSVVNPQRCHFDFSKTNRIIASGNDIVSVSDMFGSGITLSQSSSSNRPKTGLVTQNGLNVASFSAANTHFLNFSLNIPMSVPFTMFLVGKSDSAVTAIQNFIGRQTGNIAGQWVLRRETTGGVFNTFGFGSGAQSSQAARASNDVGNIHTVTLGDNIGIHYKLNNDSGATGTPRAGYDNNVITGLALGASNDAGSSPLEGWIGEVIIYGAILTTNQIAAINRYLSKKRGIAIS